MPAPDLLSEVEALIACLEAGTDPILTCERILGILDEDPTVESASLPSVSTSEVATVDFGGTWAGDEVDADTWSPEKLGATQGTWAEPPASTVRSAGLRGVCEALLDGTLPSEEALGLLSAWRDVRRPVARYQLGRPLGRGGMGEVLAARDLALDRELALKVLLRSSPAARAAFIAEAKLTARLDHPGVPPVHDVGETPDGRPYFAMKRVEGRSLREVLTQGGLRGLRPRLDLFRRVCETVAFAHDRGVLHLDLKPDNLMIGAFGEVLVMDWGLAREVTEGSATLKHVAGTPRYMAPEQATRGARLDVRTDVYSLGAILYELLADQPAFPGTDQTTVLDEVREGRFAPPRSVCSSVPRELDALVVSAMATRPDERLGSVLALLAEVEAYLEDRPLSTVRYSPWQRLQTWSRRHRASVQGATLAGVLGLVLLMGATGLYAAQLTEAWRETDAQRLAAEASARAAQKQQAQSQFTTGTVLMREHRYREAREALDASRQTLEALGLDSRASQLALAELSWRQQPTVSVELGPTQGDPVFVDDHVYVMGASGSPSVAVHVDTLEVTQLPHARQPLVLDGELWWAGADGSAFVVWGPDGTERVRREGRWRVEHHWMNSLDEPRWIDLRSGAQGAAPWLECGTTWGVVGAFYVCREAQPYASVLTHRETGEVRESYVTVASGDGRSYWNPGQVQPVVEAAQGDVRWMTDEGAARMPTSVDEGRSVAWLVTDGRVIVRDWLTSALQVAFQREGGACEGPQAYAPSRQLVAVRCEGQLELIRGVRDPLQEPPAFNRNALGRSPGGGLLVWQLSEEEVVVEGRGRRRTLPASGSYRDFAISSTGVIAMVAKEPQTVELWSPEEGRREVELGAVGLGLAWRHDGVLAVIDEEGTLHELLPDATHRRTALPDYGGGRHGWGVAPLGDGWVLSDYMGRDRAAVWVRQGAIVADLSAPGSTYAFDVAASPDEAQVVVGTDEGSWLWDGGDEAVHLPGTLSVGVAWGEHGPVVASADLGLDFFDEAGERLYEWDLGFLASSVVANQQSVRLIGADSEHPSVFRLPLGGSMGPDPLVDLWFPDE